MDKRIGTAAGKPSESAQPAEGEVGAAGPTPASIRRGLRGIQMTPARRRATSPPCHAGAVVMFRPDRLPSAVEWLDAPSSGPWMVLRLDRPRWVQPAEIGGTRPRLVQRSSNRAPAAFRARRRPGGGPAASCAFSRASMPPGAPGGGLIYIQSDRERERDTEREREREKQRQRQRERDRGRERDRNAAV